MSLALVLLNAKPLPRRRCIQSIVRDTPPDRHGSSYNRRTTPNSRARLQETRRHLYRSARTEAVLFRYEEWITGARRFPGRFEWVPWIHPAIE